MVDEFGDESKPKSNNICEWCEYRATINPDNWQYQISVALERDNFTMMTCSNGHVWSVWNGGERSIPFEQM